ncbi:hypothetical protein Kisp01_46130 [Kineosporia sp. NBRC 101677]|nr:hypothetical protein Kisp01_46130 [Kineosporia sp. NBRC 101677]
MTSLRRTTPTADLDVTQIDGLGAGQDRSPLHRTPAMLSTSPVALPARARPPRSGDRLPLTRPTCMPGVTPLNPLFRHSLPLGGQPHTPARLMPATPQHDGPLSGGADGAPLPLRAPRNY